jgi:hypothetical protein
MNSDFFFGDGKTQLIINATDTRLISTNRDAVDESSKTEDDPLLAVAGRL